MVWCLWICDGFGYEWYLILWWNLYLWWNIFCFCWLFKISCLFSSDLIYVCCLCFDIWFCCCWRRWINIWIDWIISFCLLYVWCLSDLFSRWKWNMCCLESGDGDYWCVYYFCIELLKFFCIVFYKRSSRWNG